MKAKIFSLACMLLLLSSAGAQISPISLSPATAYPSGAWYTDSVSAVADLNNDGKIDLVAVSACSPLNCLNGFGPGVISVLLGNGDGTFRPAVFYDLIGQGVVTVRVVDVNADGRPDVLPSVQDAGFHGAIGVLLGNGDGTLRPAVFYDSGGDLTMSFNVQDINADGRSDLEVANYWTTGTNATGLIGVLLGNGDGTFQYPSSFNSGGFYTSSVAVADFNGDGRNDIVAASDCLTYVSSGCQSLANGTVSILLGNGNGAFQVATPINIFRDNACVVQLASLAEKGDSAPFYNRGESHTKVERLLRHLWDFNCAEAALTV